MWGIRTPRLSERAGVTAWLTILLAVAAWLRLSGLAEWHLSWDDMWHLMEADQGSLRAIVDRNLHHQIHGPFAYVLRHGLLALTRDPLLLRITSLLPGLLLVPTFYVLGRELFGRGAGLFLAIAATFGYRLVVLSQVLRSYVLLLLLVTLALVALLIFERTQRRRHLVGYAVAAWTAAFTHVSGLVPLAALASVWTLRIARGASALGRTLPWVLANGLLLLPPALYGLLQLRFAGETVQGAPGGALEGFLAHFYFLKPLFPDGPGAALARVPDMLRFFFFHGAGAEPLPGAFLLPSALGLVLLFRDRRWTALGLVAVTLATGMLVALLGIYPFAATRHCLYAVPFVLLPAAYLAQWLYERIDGRLLTAAAVLGVALLFELSPAHHRRPQEDFDTRRADLDRTLDWLESRVGPNDVVLINRVGMQYLNLEERLFGQEVRHVGHPADHYRYPYDRWILPGGERHEFRGMTFWACQDAVHLWSSFLGAPRLLQDCLAAMARTDLGGHLDEVFFLIEKIDLFLVFATLRPLQGMPPAETPVGARLRGLQHAPFWEVFFERVVERFHAGTAGAFSLRWSDLAAAGAEPNRGGTGQGRDRGQSKKRNQSAAPKAFTPSRQPIFLPSS